MLILKQNAPTCFDLYSDHPHVARGFLVKVTEFKITKKVKLTSPHRTPCIHTTRMQPHCHNGSFTFLVNLNSSGMLQELYNKYSQRCHSS